MFKFLNKGISTPVGILIIILVAAILGGGILAYQYWWLSKEETNNVVCTMEAKLCPDGSYVGRTGPNCEFAKCPDIKKDETADWKNCFTDDDCIVFGKDGDCNCGCFNKNYSDWQPGEACFLAAPTFCKCINGKCEGFFGEDVERRSKNCLNSGGEVTTSLCCKSVDDYPNLCLIGACGCSLENSHQVKICDCGEERCFDGEQCIDVFSE